MFQLFWEYFGTSLINCTWSVSPECVPPPPDLKEWQNDQEQTHGGERRPLRYCQRDLCNFAVQMSYKAVLRQHLTSPASAACFVADKIGAASLLHLLLPWLSVPVVTQPVASIPGFVPPASVFSLSPEIITCNRVLWPESPVPAPEHTCASLSGVCSSCVALLSGLGFCSSHLCLGLGMGVLGWGLSSWGLDYSMYFFFSLLRLISFYLFWDCFCWPRHAVFFCVCVFQTSLVFPVFPPQPRVVQVLWSP